MSSTPSIDITNAKGCAVDIWTRDNLVMRITPRYNPHVNDYWMPDAGREAYKIYNENRISRPEMVVNKDSIKTSWNNALLTISEKLTGAETGKTLVFASAYASVEDNYAIQQFFARFANTTVIYVPDIKPGTGDDCSDNG